MTFGSLNAWAQESNDRLIGVYESIANKFDRQSVLILDKDSRFIYKYGVGGCRGEVTGNWKIENKRLALTNDNEFLGNDTINYPDLGLSSWTVKRNGLKPDKIVDSGCLKDNKLHRKKS